MVKCDENIFLAIGQMWCIAASPLYPLQTYTFFVPEKNFGSIKNISHIAVLIGFKTLLKMFQTPPSERWVSG
ncbi:MAG: hypothetical protein EAZ92_16770 [Candidatus Kapaibacterium sp.]|nr:MAG: hypothetical protein EAZ92_16770 [Candidatus Kapabacteria bacterium]